MNKEFIPYEQALALKELGFDEPCLATFYKKELSQYPNSREEETGFNATPFEVVKNTEVAGLIADTISAPLYQQAFRWFREKYGLQSNVSHGIIFSFVINNKSYEDFPNSEDNWFRTFEEAELACLKKLIEITKQQ